MRPGRARRRRTSGTWRRPCPSWRRCSRSRPAPPSRRRSCRRWRERVSEGVREAGLEGGGRETNVMSCEGERDVSSGSTDRPRGRGRTHKSESMLLEVRPRVARRPVPYRDGSAPLSPPWRAGEHVQRDVGALPAPDRDAARRAEESGRALEARGGREGPCTDPVSAKRTAKTPPPAALNPAPYDAGSRSRTAQPAEDVERQHAVQKREEGRRDAPEPSLTEQLRPMLLASPVLGTEALRQQPSLVSVGGRA